MAVRPAPQRPGRDLQPEAVPAKRPHLRVVPPNYVTAKTRRRRARRLAVLGGIAIAASMFGVVAFHVVLTQSQLELQKLQTRAQAASVRQQQLRLETARLESPERVVQDAQRLGMVPPVTVRYLTPGGTPGAPRVTQQPMGTTRATTPPPKTTSTAKPATAPSTVAPKPAVTKPATPTTPSTPKATKPTTPAVKPPATSATPTR